MRIFPGAASRSQSIAGDLRCRELAAELHAQSLKLHAWPHVAFGPIKCCANKAAPPLKRCFFAVSQVWRSELRQAHNKTRLAFSCGMMQPLVVASQLLSSRSVCTICNSQAALAQRRHYTGHATRVCRLAQSFGCKEGTGHWRAIYCY